METTTRGSTIQVLAQDVSAQKKVKVTGPSDATVEELVTSCLSQMSLPKNDAEDRPYVYGAVRLLPESDEAMGERLNLHDIVGDVLEDEDTIVLEPTIKAGGSVAVAD